MTSQNMNILARLALQNPDILLHFLRSGDTSPDIVSRFVDKWAGPKVTLNFTFADDSSIVSDSQKVENSMRWV